MHDILTYTKTALTAQGMAGLFKAGLTALNVRILQLTFGS